MQVIEYYSKRMDSISRAFRDGTESKPKRENFVKREIVSNRQRESEFMMILARGSVAEYELLKRMSISDFLIKFSNFAKELEASKPKKLPHGR